MRRKCRSPAIQRSTMQLFSPRCPHSFMPKPEPAT
jgi:hypothetical protein